VDVLILILTYIVVFFLGASIGSFSLVVVRRSQNKENGSWVTGKSVCESCKKELHWWEMIPTISYLILRGKCSKCKSKIDPSHFFCETAVGVAYTIIFHLFASGRIDMIQLLLMLISHAILIALSFSDILYRTINIVPVYILGIGSAIYNSIRTETYYFIAIIAGLFLLFGFLCRKDCFSLFGAGDIDICICLLAITMSGFALFDIIFYAALVGIVLSFSILRKSERNIPFVPCLYFGYILYSCGLSLSKAIYDLMNHLMSL
jgi:prepilin signal peptidase PulO-like enzyme (type II secretory pathway)